jgi:hypothetical protein
MQVQSERRLAALAVAARERVLRPDYVLVCVWEQGLQGLESAEVQRFRFFVFLEVATYATEFVDGDDYVEVVSR